VSLHKRYLSLRGFDCPSQARPCYPPSLISHLHGSVQATRLVLLCIQVGDKTTLKAGAGVQQLSCIAHTIMPPVFAHHRASARYNAGALAGLSASWLVFVLNAH
jgi:hypothetical protein